MEVIWAHRELCHLWQVLWQHIVSLFSCKLDVHNLVIIALWTNCCLLMPASGWKPLIVLVRWLEGSFHWGFIPSIWLDLGKWSTPYVPQLSCQVEIDLEVCKKSLTIDSTYERALLEGCKLQKVLAKDLSFRMHIARWKGHTIHYKAFTRVSYSVDMDSLVLWLHNKQSIQMLWISITYCRMHYSNLNGTIILLDSLLCLLDVWSIDWKKMIC